MILRYIFVLSLESIYIELSVEDKKGRICIMTYKIGCYLKTLVYATSRTMMSPNTSQPKVFGIYSRDVVAIVKRKKSNLNILFDFLLLLFFHKLHCLFEDT